METVSVIRHKECYQVHHRQSYASPIKRNISIEFKVYLMLRLLSGGHILDIHKTILISKYSLYRYFKKTIEAMNIHSPVLIY